MITLKPIVNVRELPPACAKLRQHLPSLQELCRRVPGPFQRQVLAYLCLGKDIGIYYDPRLLYDVLRPDHPIDGIRGMAAEPNKIHPQILYTDGHWIWVGALIYYITEYHLHLPDEFIHHAQSRNWRIDHSMVQPSELNTDAFDAITPYPVEAPV